MKQVLLAVVTIAAFAVIGTTPVHAQYAAVATWQNPASKLWAWAAVSGKRSDDEANKASMQLCNDIAKQKGVCKVAYKTTAPFQSVGLCFEDDVDDHVVGVFPAEGKTRLEAYENALKAMEV